jgi:hypothetical protein
VVCLGIGLVLAVSLALSGWAQPTVSGSWSLTLGLLPSLRIEESELTLELSFTSFEIESESTFAHDGLRFQSFYVSGAVGPFDLWGRIFFHAQEVRYRRAWLNVETEIGDGTIRFSLNHWSARGEYTSSDEDRFGPWPCSNTVPWHDAWRHTGRTLWVEGPVVGYSLAGHLRIHVGRSAPDYDRLDVFVSSSNLPELEEAFGAMFWKSWVGRSLCARGTVRGFRWGTGGLRDEGHSVAEMVVSSPEDLAVGRCCGYLAALVCPDAVVRWFEAHLHPGATVWIQGPVVSIAGPGTYHGYAGHFRVRIGGGAAVGNRVEVILPARPGWSIVGTSYSREVCVHGRVTVIGGVAVILPPDVLNATDGPCCLATLLPGVFLNQRLSLTWDPFSLTVDFRDCSVGLGLGRIEAAATDLPVLCCGLSFDVQAAFSKCSGLEEIALTLKGLPLGFLGMTADVGMELSPEVKTLTFTPRWPRDSACFVVYGDARWVEQTFAGISVYGWGFTYSFDRVRVRLVTALDPDAVEDMTDVTFYAHEFAYVGITYTGEGCCGGAVVSSAELWFGTRGTLFGLQRVRLELEVPLIPAVEVFTNKQWNFAQAEPLEWLDVGWRVSF